MARTIPIAHHPAPHLLSASCWGPLSRGPGKQGPVDSPCRGAIGDGADPNRPGRDHHTSGGDQPDRCPFLRPDPRQSGRRERQRTPPGSLYLSGGAGLPATGAQTALDTWLRRQSFPQRSEFQTWPPIGCLLQTPSTSLPPPPPHDIMHPVPDSVACVSFARDFRHVAGRNHVVKPAQPAERRNTQGA